MAAIVPTGEPARVRTTANGMVMAVVAVVRANATPAVAGAMCRLLTIIFVNVSNVTGFTKITEERSKGSLVSL